MESSNHKDQQLYGRRVWNLLHSMAAYYPEQPSQEDKQNAQLFLESFMEVGIDYTEWGHKFIERMKEEEVDLSGRRGFAEWMCRQHNKVNRDRKREEYDCEYGNLRKRWGPPM
ncbi:hypothetical protein FGO68_gene4348 [Halteria grandinella]|uniref:Sulfhydryl oxidase n=1 Tax=Halteria grandinella TaxID=5974 RepID=A0A8J8SYN5_HALGN|nr:hypothetical protein FGO68_gene4348 [Halteria grandinella]